MNVEYINPFIQASSSIIHQATGLKVTLGKVYLKDAPYTSSNLIVLIGLTGKIQGSVVLSFSLETAYKIASAMMGGYPVLELDEISKSAIAELGNMILGNTATIFYKNGISIDITPPTILTGNNIQLTSNKTVTVCVPLVFDDGGTVEIDISYKEKAA